MVNEMVQHFAGKGAVSSAAIAEFYRSTEPTLTQSTINWRLHHLASQGAITRVGKGLYVMRSDSNLTEYVPNPDKTVKSVYRILKRELPDLDVCLWNSSELNSYAQHLSNRTFVLAETAKDCVESVFYSLKDAGKNVYLKPSKDIIENYLFDRPEPIIVQSLISESPVIEVDGLRGPSIEKILVDIFCEDDLFAPYQGRERTHVFKNAFAAHNINITRLLRYASRRGKKPEMQQYLRQILSAR